MAVSKGTHWVRLLPKSSMTVNKALRSQITWTVHELKFGVLPLTRKMNQSQTYA